LETDDVNRLHVVFPSGNFVKDVISLYLVVLDHTTNLEFEHTADHGDLFGDFVPDQTLQYDFFLYFLPETVEIVVLLIHFHFEHHN